MVPADEQNNQPAEQNAGWPRRSFAKAVAGLGAGTAALLSLAYASYTLSRPAEIAVIAPGQAVDTGRWKVAISSARFAKADSQEKFYLDRKDSLQVDFELTNLSQESSSSYARVARIEPQPSSLGEPTFKLVRDGSIAGSLHPGMTEHLTAYWTLPPGTPAPSELSFSFNGETYKPRDNLYSAPGWFPADPVARTTLPVARPAG